MRPPTQTVMPEHPPQNELNIEHKDGKQREREQAGMTLVELHARLFFYPSASGEDSNRNRDAKERLGDRGMRGRNRRRLQEQNGEAPEDRLSNHGAEGTNGQPAHPTSTLHQQGPEGDTQGQSDQ